MIIIDSNYLCYISKFALSQGLTYRGGRTEIIYGFLKNIISLSKKFETNDFVFCWDSKHSKRKNIFPDYKAKRHNDKTEEEKELDAIAYAQFNILKISVLSNLGFSNVFHSPGYEADDLIASVVIHNPDTGNIVVSSDEDLFQLLDYCSIYNFSKKATMNKNLFMRTYGIEPKQWAEVKCIAGCSSDNVPGVKGVGEKTAIKYIQGTLKTSSKVFDSIKTRSLDDETLIRKLVTLPFPGTKKVRIENNSLSETKFTEVINEYGIKSINIDDWKTLMMR
jgi:5'-3' exonuclease